MRYVKGIVSLDNMEAQVCMGFCYLTTASETAKKSECIAADLKQRIRTESCCNLPAAV